MKRTITLVFMASYVVFSACKGGNKKAEGDAATTQQTPAAAAEEQKPAITNQPKEYKVTITPDSAILGKKKEALVKIHGATAVALQDPDGKDNGIELVVKLTLTNKGKIGEGSSIYIDYSKSRLQLDNGTNITCDTGTDFLKAETEATSKEESWTYKIPAGAKPTALNLFMDDTRVSVNLSLN